MMRKPERERLIAQEVALDGGVRVDELSRRLGVSEVTIRSDLKELESAGVLVRTRGGALPASAVARPAPSAAAWPAALEKQAIAREIAAQVEAGSWIFLGSGTTCLAIAQALADSEVNVVTNSLAAAEVLARAPQVQTVATGGLVFSTELPFLYGDAFDASLASMAIDLALVGVAGIDKTFGYSFSNTVENGIVAKVRKVSRRLVVASDASKFGRTAFKGGLMLSVADEIVTAGSVTEENRAICEDCGVRLVEASLT